MIISPMLPASHNRPLSQAECPSPQEAFTTHKPNLDNPKQGLDLSAMRTVTLDLRRTSVLACLSMGYQRDHRRHSGKSLVRLTSWLLLWCWVGKCRRPTSSQNQRTSFNNELGLRFQLFCSRKSSRLLRHFTAWVSLGGSKI